MLTGPAVASAGAFLQPRGRLGEEPTRTWGIRAEPTSSSNTATRLASSRGLGAEGRVRGALLLPAASRQGSWPGRQWSNQGSRGGSRAGPQLASQTRVRGPDSRLIPTLQVPVSRGPCLRARNLCRPSAWGLGPRDG